jgi:hypothetical protein
MHAARGGITPALLLSASCLGSSPKAPEHAVVGVPDLAIETIAPPTPAGLYPSFACTTDGRVILAWTEEAEFEDGPGHRLRWSAFDGRGFDPPTTIAQGGAWFVNWADFPTLAVVGSGDSSLWVASWLERFEGRPTAYGARVATSRGDGRSWSAGSDLMSDASGPEYGFVSLVPLPARIHGAVSQAGRVQAVWLDGRSAREPHAGGMALRTRAILPDGSLGPESVLDERVCDCCQTAAVLGEDGILVAYRDRDESEVRDISILLGDDSTSASWSQVKTVHDDGWSIEGCPVNGPALDSRDDRVVLAWYTAADDEGRVLVAFSDDAGHSFADPIRIDEGGTAGRVDACFLADGTALVSWLENTGESFAWKVVALREIDGEAASSASVTLGVVRGDRRDGFLRLTPRAGGALAAWTDGTSGELHVRAIDAR